MIDLFRNSFYSLWFQNIPDQIIESAMNEVSGFSESRLISNSCPRIADEYLILKTVAFLTTYMNVGGEFTLSLGEDEETTISMKGVSDTGVQSFVRKDSIDSSLSREYHTPSIPEGYDASDFPHGAIKDRIEKLETTCKKANAFVGGGGSNRPMGHCGSKGVADNKHVFPESDKCKVDCNGVANRAFHKNAKTC